MADKSKLIAGLNEDLANELGTVILYLYQTSVAGGFDGEELREFLRGEITGELNHAIFLADKVVALGGDPTRTPTKFDTPKNVKGMLKYDWKLELDTIENYKKRAKQAEEVGDIGLKVKLEEMIVEETAHAEQLARILKAV